MNDPMLPCYEESRGGRRDFQSTSTVELWHEWEACEFDIVSVLKAYTDSIGSSPHCTRLHRLDWVGNRSRSHLPLSHCWYPHGTLPSSQRRLRAHATTIAAGPAIKSGPYTSRTSLWDIGKGPSSKDMMMTMRKWRRERK